MVNAMKVKGDAYERHVENFLRENGFPEATRTRPGRMEDQGDIFVTPGVIAQVKDVATPNWREWLTQLAEQKARAKARFAFLVLKRRGAGGRPPLHLAVVPLDEFTALLSEHEQNLYRLESLDR